MKYSNFAVGKLFTIRKGRKAPQAFCFSAKDSKRYIQINDLRSEEDLQYTDDPNGVEVLPSDICIAWDGANAGTIGYGLHGYIGSTIARLRPTDSDLIYSPFVGRFLQSNFQLLNNRTTGATIPHVSKDFLTQLKIPLPNKKEQKRIVKIIDKADAIRRKRQQAIQLADEFLRSVFLDMFGDPVSNPKDWKIETISNLLSDRPNAIRTGPFGSQLKHLEFISEGVPVLGIDNIVTNEFRWTKPRCLPQDRFEDFQRYLVCPDDVIVTIMGTTGKVVVAPADLPKCMSTKHLCVMTLNKDLVDSVFLWATLLFDQVVRSQTKISGGGAIMEGWNMSIIKNLKIRIPPIDLQRKFRKIVEKIKQGSSNSQNFLNETEKLFSSLNQRAFRGEL